MPHHSQGDIFQVAQRVQLAIVFGHVGFNDMRQCWLQFSQRIEQLSLVIDPFIEIAGRAIQWSPNNWVWFFPAQKNHGMSDEDLINALNSAFIWASRNGIESIATNGIANTDHGSCVDEKRSSDLKRAKFLKNYATQLEQRYQMTVELVSLNDVFVRVL